MLSISVTHALQLLNNSFTETQLVKLHITKRWQVKPHCSLQTLVLVFKYPLLCPSYYSTVKQSNTYKHNSQAGINKKKKQNLTLFFFV